MQYHWNIHILKWNKIIDAYMIGAIYWRFLYDEIKN